MDRAEDRYTDRLIIGYDERGLGLGWRELQCPDLRRWTGEEFFFKIRNAGKNRLTILARSHMRDGAQRMTIHVGGKYCGGHRLLNGWNLYGLALSSNSDILDVHIKLNRVFPARSRGGGLGIEVKALCAGGEREIYSALDEQLKFIKGLPGTRAMPVRLTANTTDRCNLNCPTCPKQQDDGNNMKKAEMPEELFEKIFSEAAPYLERLHLSISGEPLLTRDLCGILDRAREMSLGIDITTNGILLNTPELARRILESASLLVVSVDACTRETYAKVRAGADFGRLVKNIEMLRDLRGTVRTRADFSLDLHYVLMRSNIDELPGFISFARKMNADIVTAKHINVFNPEFKNESLVYHKKLANECLRKAIRVAAELKMPLNTPPLYRIGDEPVNPVPEFRGAPLPKAKGVAATVKSILKSLNSRVQRLLSTATPLEAGSMPAGIDESALMGSCDFLWKQAIIEVTGEINLCCNFHPKTPRPGNVSQQTIMDIWNAKTYRSLRRAFLSDSPPIFCRHCPFILGEPLPDDEVSYLKFQAP